VILAQIGVDLHPETKFGQTLQILLQWQIATPIANELIF
jgi:hypothetical protein